jgi:hypothetical protein
VIPAGRFRFSTLCSWLRESSSWSWSTYHLVHRFLEEKLELEHLFHQCLHLFVRGKE